MSLEQDTVGQIREGKASVARRWLAQRSPIQQFTIGLWVLIGVVICFHPLVAHDPGRHSVFGVFTNAAQNWLHGRELYVRGSTLEYRYSPIIAATFVPFDLLGSRLGQVVWRLLNISVYLGGLIYCCRVELPRRWSGGELAAIFLLTMPLSIGSLNDAQSNPLVTGLMLIAVAGVLRERWNLAAICITVACLYKLYPIALGLLLVAMYPRKMGWRLALCLAVGLLLPFALQHWHYVLRQYQTWWVYLRKEDRQFGPMKDWYRDFRAVWRIYIHSMPLRTYVMIELAGAAAIAGICLAARRSNWPEAVLLGLTLSLACGWMTVLGPATESATYILLAPACAWVLVEANRWPTTWPAAGLRIGYGTAFGLFCVAQIMLWFGPRGAWVRDHLQPLPIAGGILIVCLMAQAMGMLKKHCDQFVSSSADNSVLGLNP